MKRFILEKSNADIVSHGGLALIGQAIKRYTNLTREVNAQVPARHSAFGYSKNLYRTAVYRKNDFEAINTIESECFFTSAMNVAEIPSEATLCLRMDKHAKDFYPLLKNLT